ncbi:hypothetical protein [Acaryochloris sp. CCMEE 5410]|nr:hypothetical protein [Acaryochloris sp. CCMEE 5410]KAI9133884.1 hypothetical protein ON05_011645 [Acaryochloris sp. CCMEE 5410]
MFEFHGWAVIHYHTHDTDGIKQDECWRKVEKYGSPGISVVAARYSV